MVCMSQVMKADKDSNFDPLAYIESGFSDNNSAKPSSSKATGATATAEPKMKFRKRQLSAPRPRKVRAAAEPTQASVVDSELEEVWTLLPRNIHFLTSYFDDSVTAHYYRGEFKETREELIKRLLDPELSLEEVARILGVCPATVRRYTNRNWLRHHRTKGGQRRFRLSGVVKFVESHGRHPED